VPHLPQTGLTMIFKTTQQKKTKPQYRGSSLFPVLSADKLLASDKKQIVLEKMQAKVDFPLHYYRLLYGNLLHDFAEFVQLIPTQMYGKLSQLLNDGLHRGLLALQICTEEGKSPLFTYAVFTAALLENIGIVPTQQIVILSNKRGEFIKEWQPVFGSMAAFGDYYKLRFTGERWINLKHYLTPILAQQLLPELGLQWLLTDKRLYEMWLAILTGDDKTGWEIKLILQLIDERLDDLRRELDFEDVDVPITAPEETEAGEKFLEWLIDGLDDGTIKVNEKDAFVHVVDLKLPLSPWESNNEINSDPLPLPLLNLNLLKQTTRSKTELHTQQCPSSSPLPIMMMQVLVHLGDAQMNRIPGTWASS